MIIHTKPAISLHCQITVACGDHWKGYSVVKNVWLAVLKIKWPLIALGSVILETRIWGLRFQYKSGISVQNWHRGFLISLAKNKVATSGNWTHNTNHHLLNGKIASTLWAVNIPWNKVNLLWLVSVFRSIKKKVHSLVNKLRCTETPLIAFWFHTNYKLLLMRHYLVA